MVFMVEFQQPLRTEPHVDCVSMERHSDLMRRRFFCRHRVCDRPSAGLQTPGYLDRSALLHRRPSQIRHEGCRGLGECEEESEDGGTSRAPIACKVSIL